MNSVEKSEWAERFQAVTAKGDAASELGVPSASFGSDFSPPHITEAQSDIGWDLFKSIDDTLRKVTNAFIPNQHRAGPAHPKSKVVAKRAAKLSPAAAAIANRDALEKASRAREAAHHGEGLSEDEFSGEPEKKGLPGWVMALLGILGIYVAAEVVNKKATDKFVHRLMP
jgi:hypothetical protein